ncbi:MAG: glycosyltransferase family 4 protein [Bacteroidia bacterium]|nr:glycosyltransferase family 4 protein [Bacteroidia bacterium]
MKLLILSQYFPPEVGAPQNRLFELAVRLHKMGVEVTVLTAMPNYPQMEIHPNYREKSYTYEEMSGLKVHRSSIYVSKNRDILSRLRNYFSFVISSARIGNKKLGHVDFLLCESPPLFLGYSAMYLARRKKAKLIFNVSDLWPESAEKLGVVNNKLLLSFAYRLEAKLYRKSVFVSGQTQGICKNIQQRFPEVKTYWLPNGVDLSYYNPSEIQAGHWRQKQGFATDDVLFLYAGIIGIAQGLEVILKAAKALQENKHLKFVLMGSGPEKQKLENLKTEWTLNNVFFLDAVTKAEMPAVLKSVNASIIPLRKLELFLGAIPSKIFESLAMELPILLGVDGEARDLFIHQGQCGFYFEPENAEALASAIRELCADSGNFTKFGKNGRAYVQQQFDRERIALTFLEELKKHE